MKVKKHLQNKENSKSNTTNHNQINATASPRRKARKI